MIPTSTDIDTFLYYFWLFLVNCLIPNIQKKESEIRSSRNRQPTNQVRHCGSQVVKPSMVVQNPHWKHIDVGDLRQSYHTDKLHQGHQGSVFVFWKITHIYIYLYTYTYICKSGGCLSDVSWFFKWSLGEKMSTLTILFFHRGGSTTT